MLKQMLVTGSLMLAATAFAQQGPPPPHFRGGMQGRFLGAEPGMPGRVVTNAPFSADIVTDTTQTLANGNRIHRTTTTHVYRDSAGRTRREQDLSNLNVSSSSTAPQVVFINDPVAGVNYALSPSKKTATRSASMRPRPNGGQGNNSGNGRGAMARVRQGRQNNPNVVTEDLGTQMVQGVQANGRRMTMTIPAGQIGNDQALQIVNETWFSPDLQMVVLSKRSDPRSGDTVVSYTNLNRSEPSSTLFQVPADYSVSDAPHVRMGQPRN